MKKVFAAMAIVVLTAAGFAAWAADVGNKTSSEEHTADVKMELTARLVTLPDAPSFTAKGTGTLHYILNGLQAVIKGDSIPKLVFESDGPVAIFKRLTIIAQGTPGNDPVVDWTAYPRIVLKPVDLHLSAYEVAAAEVTDSTKPIFDVTIPDLTFSTDSVEVEGEESKGYVNADGPEVQLVAKATLPDGPMPEYSALLAGKPVIFELRVGLVNPYEPQK